MQVVTGELLHVVEAESIPHVDMARVASENTFHKEIVEAQSRNAHTEAYRYDIFPIVGIEQL